MTMFNPRDTVRVRGANVPMNTQEPPPQEDENGGFLRNVLRGAQEVARRQREWNQQAQGINVIPAFLSEAALDTASILGNTLGQTGRFFSGQAPDPSADIGSRLFGGPQENILSVLGGGTPTPPAKQRGAAPPKQPMDEVPAGLTASEWLGQNVGAFDESPYRNYMNFLATQDEETMARINALYNQLANEAAANMERIGDIYGSAQMTSGDVYGGSAQAIEDAYGSAQQQAADQMARLGIEAAAPGVIDPMALSQAEAVAGIEAAGAGALDALTRYGSSAQDFGSQMAQVAQQQGLEVSNQLLRDMAQRQADAMFQMEQARANYNPYANLLQQLELENAYNEPMLREQELFNRAQQEAFQLQVETTLSRRDRLTRIWEGLVADGMDPQQAMMDAETAVARAEQLYPMP